MSSAQTTHSTECWKWHLECAGREVERLRAEKESIATALTQSNNDLAAEVERLRDDLARERKQSALAWRKADEWGWEALEAHQKNATLSLAISGVRALMGDGEVDDADLAEVFLKWDV